MRAVVAGEVAEVGVEAAEERVVVGVVKNEAKAVSCDSESKAGES